MIKDNVVDMKIAREQIKSIINEVRKVVIGKDQIIIKVMLAIIAGGHILIEDIPGVGKTTMALAFSKVMSLNQNRMQFTPDVLPTDVTGFSIYNKNTGNFDYKPGAAVCNLFLADEINRTSSKTQSALLELMEEGNVTVDSVTRELPKPYIVIATQNPIGSIGTHMLPESQLDRFMIRISMGYPDIRSEINIMKSKNEDVLASVCPIVSAFDVLNIQSAAEQIYIDDKIYMYIAKLVNATRNNPLIKLCVSPRGTIALTAMTKASAMLRGRNYVIPEDVEYIFEDVAAHRIILNSKAHISNLSVEKVLNDILNSVSVPQIGREQNE